MQLHHHASSFESLSTTTTNRLAPSLLLSFDSSTATTTTTKLSTMPILLDATSSLQRVGESTFTALFLIAFLQAIVVVFQYRSNPAGELIEPPGPTVGVEEPSNNYDMMMRMSATSLEQSRPPFWQRVGDMAMKPPNNTNSTMTTTTSRYARILNRLNRALFLLLPFAARTASAVLARQWHLLQIGFILGMARVFDYPAAFFERHHLKATSIQQQQSSTNTNIPSPLHNIMVIGDSLAIGIGSVNLFDANKNQTIDYHLSENLYTNSSNINNNHSNISPVFPKVLASTLADYQNRSVSWRSCGVDGGTVSHIQQFCLDVLRQECRNGHSPNMVVLLCGSNDLKQFVANPLSSEYTPKKFRTKLWQLVSEIRTICADNNNNNNTMVVLPALPTQTLKVVGSPLNIFPLSLFLDVVVGFWESQKKLVVDNFPSSNVLFVDLSRREIEEWYHRSSSSSSNDEADVGSRSRSRSKSLMAADGVHPNAECYAKWAESVAKRVYERQQQQKQQEH